YWWANINEAAKSAYLTCPTCPKYNQGSLSVLLPDILNYVMDHVMFGKWILYNFPCVMDINMF
ncbi:hypothetical protein, partial [Listeria monocytogenes]|uniref:hypothetical protein n=1 Tax=Listeria monocytogenes TaxID=1639 RepID=UPI001A922705